MIEEVMDVLVFGPHPDDAELAAGGFLLSMHSLGYGTAIADLTRGELGTKGDAETRAKEASAAARALEISKRHCLDLGDGQLADVPEQRNVVVDLIRTLKPRLIIAPGPQDEHPDHRAAYELVRSAFFLSRLPKFNPSKPLHAAEMLWTYGIHFENPGSFVFDISNVFEQKKNALRCYESQFVKPQTPEGYRYAGISDYLEQIEVRAKMWGQRIGVAYGEAFYSVTTLSIGDPFEERIPTHAKTQRRKG